MESVQKIFIVMDSFDNKLFNVHAAICLAVERELNGIFLTDYGMYFSIGRIIINIRIYSQDFIQRFDDYNKELLKYSKKKSEIVISTNIDYNKVVNETSRQTFKTILEGTISCFERLKKHIKSNELFEEKMEAVRRLALPEAFKPPNNPLEIPE